MKNKKAFTLIELLAVIIILAIVALIATPIVLNVVEDAKKSAGQSEANMIMNGIINYCETEKMGMGVKKLICNNGVTKEEVNQMVNLGKAEVLEIEYGNKLTWLKVKSNGHIYGLENGKMVRDLVDKPPTKPNAPNLLGKLTPIYYDTDGQWKKADVNTKWYDYDNKEWANAVVLKDGVTKSNHEVINVDSTDEKVNEIDLWYVWIPRFKYQLFDANKKNSEIKIEFEYKTLTTGNVKCVDLPKEELAKPGGPSESCYKIDDENKKTGIGDWYTHPAFTLGDKELEGIWVGKFETSGTINDMKIKPNVSSLRSVNVSTFSDSFQSMSEKLNGDSHMMKNMEWGAVTYLAQSKYGLCTDGICENITINNNSDFITGIAGDTKDASLSAEKVNTWDTKKGQKASTTQNIYGIYDMSGGAWEYVMGSSASSTGEFGNAYAGFTENPNPNYHDLYTYDTTNTSTDRGKLGDATKETKTWQGDYAYFPYGSRPWFGRGGYYGNSSYAGVFYFYGYNGNAYSYYSARGVLSAR